jgi:hypothetical protein
MLLSMDIFCEWKQWSFSKVHVMMNKIFYARFGNHLNSINYSCQLPCHFKVWKKYKENVSQIVIWHFLILVFFCPFNHTFTLCPMDYLVWNQWRARIEHTPNLCEIHNFKWLDPTSSNMCIWILGARIDKIYVLTHWD